MKVLLVTLAYFFAGAAHAQDTSSGGEAELIQVPLYADVSIASGYATASGADLSSDQKLMGMSGGVTLGIGGTLFGGVQFEYRQIDQTSAVNPDDGNFRGFRRFFAPIIGFRSSGFVVKADYQTSGNYQLTNKTASDTSIAYVSPSGFRVTALYKLWLGVHAGISYESVSYQFRHESLPEETKLEPKLTVNQINAVVSYVF